MDFICTWIYLDSPEESSVYPQVGKKSHLANFQKVYWKCVAVFFAFSTRFNPQRRHLLFSNRQASDIPVIDGFDLQAFLTSKHVEVVTLPLTWQPPEGWHHHWRNQFYIFDILSFFEKKFTPSPGLSTPAEETSIPAFLVLDSDCLINRSLDRLFDEIRRNGLLTLPLDYGLDHNINGVTRRDLRRLYTELDGRDPGQEPVYYGGEVFAATLPVVRQINALAPAIWQSMLERYRLRQPKFNEEAHFLSYLYHRIGGFGSLEGFIKRIWTSVQYSNVKPEDVQLPIWHLPSEKTGGIALLFKELAAEWPLRAEERSEETLQPGFLNLPAAELGRYVGVPKRKRYLDLKHFLKHTTIYKWLKRN